MKCESCKKESEYLESHHIVPKSRGGSDNKSNLINLCVDCHGKAHDVSFSNNRGGLLKEGIVKSRNKNIEGKSWLQNNEKLYQDKMMDLCEKDEVKYGLLMGLIHNGNMDAYSIMKYVKGERVVIKTQVTLN